jgi:UDP-N-acetylmuramoyl-tripeptide--D-alanyl-D-alanine ligase
MIREIISLYRPSYVRTLVYMLQSTEYQAGPYLKWWWRTKNYDQVMKRRQLNPTKAAKLLMLGIGGGMLLTYISGLVLIILDFNGSLIFGLELGMIIWLLNPILWAHLAVVPLEIGRYFIVMPRQRRIIAESRLIFNTHPAIKIAIAGSYGKTSMKELLATVLGEARTVAATPGNKNVAISHAYFAKRLSGKEEVLIIELGEGEPGDVARFAKNIKPTHAIVTGVAPAHLDRYKDLKDAGNDIFSVTSAVPKGQAFVNAATESIKPFIQDHQVHFDETGALGWKISAVKVGLDGTSFTLTKGKHRIALHSQLVGRHHVPTLAFVAALALQIGLTPEQVKAGVAKTRPYEHRMQPYNLNGAWIIDDTYNGNIEGIRAGTRLLVELPAKRKIYVTPGLVDQGIETEPVHVELGELIGLAQPNIVVLMANSVTKYIERGLDAAGFKGEVRIEHNPLQFYQNLDQIVAAGDLVLMQNDWTDNYA